MRLSIAFSCICWAMARISSGLAVEVMTNSTGKSPPPGSGGGVIDISRTPGIAAQLLLHLGQYLLHRALALASRVL